MSIRKKLAYFYRHSPAEVATDIRQKLTSGKRRAALSGQVVYVLSTGRVGSQTLAALFSKVKEIACYHEPRPKLFELSAASYSMEKDQGVALEDAALKSARCQIWEKAEKSGRIYFETSPQATFMARAISRLRPDVRFVHLVRDPFTTIRSGMRRCWYNGNALDSGRIIPRAGSEWSERWQTCSYLEKNAWLWAETNDWIGKFVANLPSEKRVIARSEDLFAGDENVIAEIAELLGVNPPCIKQNFSILSKQLNRQRGGDFEWNNKSRECVWEIVAEQARLYGYDI